MPTLDNDGQPLGSNISACRCLDEGSNNFVIAKTLLFSIKYDLIETPGLDKAFYIGLPVRVKTSQIIVYPKVTSGDLKKIVYCQMEILGH